MAVAELVILFMIAAFILLQLRRELGKKNGDEDLLPPRPRQHQDHNQARDKDNTGPMPHDNDEYGAPQEDSVVSMEADPVLRRAWQDIRSADPNFTPDVFTQGAASAYGMILEAYWQGDKDLLEGMLDDELYEQFAGSVDERADTGISMDNKLLSIDNVEVHHARMHGSSAEITVNFDAEVLAVTKDADGTIIDGDEKETVQYKDRWTFARNTLSDDPNWTLVATEAL